MMAGGFHPFPSRTRQLSPHAPRVLGWKRPGRVGRRRFSRNKTLPFTAEGFYSPGIDDEFISDFAGRNSYIPDEYYRHGPVAQLDRAPDFESVGRVFESRRGHQ